MVVFDVSRINSAQCFEIPEMVGISTTPPPPSPSIRWIAKPIIAFVLLIVIIILLLYCTFTSHLIPSDHNTHSTNTNHDTTSVSTPPHTTNSTHNSLSYESDDRETENVVSLKKIEEEEGGKYAKMEELRGGWFFKQPSLLFPSLLFSVSNIDFTDPISVKPSRYT